MEFENRFPEFVTKYKTAIGNLSGGQHRLVDLNVILKTKAQFALLDEPFTHLNPIQIEKVKMLILEEKENKGLIITDHMYQHIVDISDNLYVLTNGKTHLTKSVYDIETLGYARI